jgi:F-type H+-transporting ATPase subunit alpha
LNKVPVNEVRNFEREFIDYLRATHAETLATLKSGALTDEVTKTLEKVAAELTSKYAK